MQFQTLCIEVKRYESKNSYAKLGGIMKIEIDVGTTSRTARRSTSSSDKLMYL